MKEGKRQKQVSALLLEEVNKIFQRLGLNMIQGGMVSISSVKITPDLFEARIYLSFYQVAKPKEALKLITEQMKKEPNSIAARRYYAFALVHNDSPKSAIEQILYQMPRLPGYQRSAFDWCTLGDAYLQAASFDNAETSYNGALRLEPENYAAKGGLLRTTAKKGKVDDALKQCDLLINQYAKQPAVQAYYKGIYALPSITNVRI